MNICLISEDYEEEEEQGEEEEEEEEEEVDDEEEEVEVEIVGDEDEEKEEDVQEEELEITEDENEFSAIDNSKLEILSDRKGKLANSYCHEKKQKLIETTNLIPIFYLLSDELPVKKTDYSYSLLKKRQGELLKVITFNKAKIRLYDHPPLSYDAFIQLFGGRNMKQVSCQTVTLSDVQAQTEVINCDTRTTQWPACFSNQSSEVTVIKNPIEFHAFILKAEKIVSGLIHSKLSSITYSPSSKLNGKIYKLPQNLNAKELVSLHTFGNKILALYRVDKLATFKSLIVVWVEGLFDQIQFTLTSNYELFKITSDEICLIFGANHDGCLSVWDLREPDYRHQNQLKFDNQVTILRRPSFYISCIEFCNSNRRLVDCLFKKSLQQLTNDQIVIAYDDFSLDIWKIDKLIEPDLAFSDQGTGMTCFSQIKLTQIKSLKIPPIMSIKSHLVSFDLLGPQSYLLASLIDGIFVFTSNHNNNANLEEDCRFEYMNEAGFVPIKMVKHNLYYDNQFIVVFEDMTIGVYNIECKNPIKIITSSESKLTCVVDIYWTSKDSLVVLDKFDGIKLIKIGETIEITELINKSMTCFYPTLNSSKNLKIVYNAHDLNIITWTNS